jgi:RHS repeat-associated protein
MSTLNQRRRVAAALLYTFGIEAAAPPVMIGARLAATVATTVAAIKVSGPTVSGQTLPACDAALLGRQAPISGVTSSRLWPANHSMQAVGYSAALGAACVGLAEMSVQVWSDEPDEAQTGDGNHTPDAALAPLMQLQLRAERKGNSDGRVYLILARATSPSGATNTSCASVGVPKSQSSRDRDALDAQMGAASFFCAANGGPPQGFIRLLDEPWVMGPVNQPPQVSAGLDISLPFGTPASLGGVGSDDGLPAGTLSFQWSAVSGPGAVLFVDSAQASTSATFSASGTYQLRLTASDGVLQSVDELTVTVGPQNAPPVVSAGPDVAVTLPANSLTLSGSASDDSLPAGILNVNWSVVSGSGVSLSSPASLTTVATFPSAGTYVLRLSASDGSLSSFDDVQVIVNQPANVPPSVDAGPDQTLSLPDGTVSLAGAISDDGQPTGTLTSQWTQVSGPGPALISSPLSPETSVMVTLAGAYVFRLSATDGVLSASDDLTLVVTAPPNEAPLAVAGSDIEIRQPTPGGELSGSATDDGNPDGTLTFVWSQVSGPGPVTFSDPQSPTTGFAAPLLGTYVLRLTVSDGLLSGWDEVTVVVLPEPPPDISVDDTSVAEGSDGRRVVQAMVRLSRVAATEVRVDFVTTPGTAGAGCDYETAFGTLVFAPGQTEVTVALFINGDLMAEGSESFDVLLGNPVGAAIADSSGNVTLHDDDAPNAPPTRSAERQPPQNAIEQPLGTLLSWAPSLDPEGGPVSYEVQFGSTFGMTGQRWTASCSATPEPPARAASASAYDEATDRLFVFGGSSGLQALGDLWVLKRATAAGGSASWEQIQAPAGPGARQHARAVFDQATDRLVVVGGCLNSCDAAFSDVWALGDASTGTPSWQALPPLPQPRGAHAMAFDETNGRIFVFGGVAAGGASNDILRMDIRAAAPQWTFVATTGEQPPALQNAAMSYDSQADRLIVHAGQTTSGASSDTYALAGASTTSPAWVRLAPVGPIPAARFGHALHYDEVTDRALLFGGTTAGVENDTNFVTSDTWVLAGSRTATPAWVRLEALDAPTPRYDAATAYSVEENRLVAVFGSNNKIQATALVEGGVLEDAIGRIDTVSTGQSDVTFAPVVNQNETYLWRTVARDEASARAGTRAMVFSTGLPSLTVEGASVVEGNVGETTLAFRVSLSRPATDEVSVDLTVGGGTALPGIDFQPVQARLVFAPGETVQLINVAILGDLIPEADETVNAVLENVIGASIRTSSAVGMILNDDFANAPPQVSAGPSQTSSWTPSPLGRVVVNFDEWTLSNNVFLPATATYAQNIARWFSPDGPGSLVAISSNFGLTGSSLAAAIRADGHTWTVNPALPMTLASLSQYDGVFLTTDRAYDPVIAEYVYQGGNVYVGAGTGVGGPLGETNRWNPFLSLFSMRLVPTYVDAQPLLSSTHPLLQGVASIRGIGGNPVALTTSPDPRSAILVFAGANGLVGAFDGRQAGFGSVVVPLVGTVVDDGLPEPSNLSHLWTQLAGPAQGVIVNPTQQSTSVSLQSLGTYTFRLTASDGELSASSEATITVVENLPPQIDAGPDQYLELPVSTTQLSGSADDDGVPGGPLQYQWSQLAGPGVASFASPGLPATSVDFSVAGAYVLRLTVSDGDGAAFDDVRIAVKDPLNTPPEVVPAPPMAVQSRTFVVAAQVVDDGRPLGGTISASWAIESLPLGAVVSVSDPAALSTTVTVSIDGTYVFRVIVSDGELSTDALLAFNVDGRNRPPVVDAGADQSITVSQTTLSSSYADDGQPSGGSPTTLWVQVEGPATAAIAEPDQATTLVHFTAVGTYVFMAIVNDGELEGVDETIVVVSQPNDPPAVSAGPDQALAASEASLNGSVSDDGRPLGSTLSVQWNQVSGPAAAQINTPTVLTTRVSLPAEGDYVFRLTASDGASSAADDVAITRLAGTATNLPPAVNAGPDRVVATLTSQLTGSFNDDGVPVGGQALFLWSQTSGPSIASIAAPGQLATQVQFPTSGTFGFRLQATDGELTALDDVTITVVIVENPPPPLNLPPAVNAGADQALTLPTLATLLQGTAIDDGLPEASSVSTQWTQRAGPAGVVFQQPDATNTVATFPAAGTYVLRLSATDTQVTGFDDVTVTIGGADPVGGAPTIAITSPGDSASITSPTEIIGSIQSAQLLDWKLEIKERSEVAYRTIATGNTPVSNAAITSFDPTMLLNGLYDLHFVARDTALRTTTVARTAVVRENLKVGQFSVSFVDLEVPVAGLPIRVTRTYDSRDKGKGDFGYGWRLDLSNVTVRESGSLATGFVGTITPGFFPSYCLQASRPQVVTVTLPGGEVMEFEPRITPGCQSFAPIAVASISYVPRPGSTTQGTLRPASGNTVLVSGVTGPVQLFDEATYNFFDPNEYILTLPDGRELTVHQTTGLKRIKDLNGNMLNVTSSGITHSSGRGIAFARDTQGRITSVTDPAGNVQTYAYDAAGDLIGHTDRENNETTFTYLATPAHHLEEIHDALGRTPIRNEYYPDGRIQRHTDAYGKTIEYAHDVTGRQEVVTDREGNVRVLHYDGRGNVTKEVQPDGKQILRTFDGRNNRTSETEPHEQTNLTPATTSWTYDAADNVTSTTDPLNNVTSQTYNARRQILTSTDARSKTTTNVYDVKGNLTSTTDADGHVTTFTYDTKGNLLSQSQTVNGLVETTTNTYDAFGNLLTETDALGRVTTSTYDTQGNRKTETRTRTLPGGATETLTTSYVYDKNGRLTKATDPDGTFTETVYDAAGRQTSTKDKLGRATTFEYDDMGRLTKTIYPDTTFEESTYDGEGRRLTSKDRAGRITSHEYDGLGRMRKTVYADATFTENFYDVAGRLESTKDARGKITSYEYDSAGRRTKVIDPLNHETVFTYDANGNQKTVKDANNNTTTYEYDDLNRRTKTIFPDATFTETGYDEAGRRVSERDQGGKITQFQYDKLGRLVSVIPAQAGIQPTTYTYDEVGNRLTQTDANNRTTSFEYDKLGREVARILPDGARETKTYDILGNLATRTDFLGRVTTYAYDINNRPTSRTAACTPCEKADASWTYTLTGRRASATYLLGGASVSETYGYDNRDRLATKAMTGGNLTYTYDANGNRETLTSTVGAAVTTATYAYDDASRLDTVTDTLGRVYDLGYDAVGNRTSLAHPNGVTMAYGYNTLNRLTNLTTQNGATTIQSHAFTLGPSGNRTQIVEADKTKTYTYDDLYRLTGETLTGSTIYSKVFGYDPVGNRQTQTTTGSAGVIVTPGTINYGYDNRDRLLTENATTYGYDANGNLTTQSGFGTYTFDTENRLVRIAKSDGTLIEHAYDADGARIRTETTPPAAAKQTTNFVVDTSGGLSHVVAEFDAAGVQTNYYLRALDDLLAVIRPTVTPGVFTTRYYHADGIGSIRKLTADTGAVTDSYEYTAFGEQYEHVGGDPQPYSFAGEPLDPNSGFQYHRARWMQPSTGRFAGMDPWRGREFDPVSLHRFQYAGASPADFIDPTGEFSLTVGFAVTAIIGLVGYAAFRSWRHHQSNDVNAAGLAAVRAAVPLVDAAIADISSSTPSTQSAQFTRWFGAQANTLRVQILRSFLLIRHALLQPITFERTNKNVFAYVYAGGELRIWLGPLFFAAQTVGFDSRAGTIVHELSHEVAQTHDLVYGQNNARALARNSPGLAAANADNFEYFAEDR